MCERRLLALCATTRLIPNTPLRWFARFLSKRLATSASSKIWKSSAFAGSRAQGQSTNAMCRHLLTNRHSKTRQFLSVHMCLLKAPSAERSCETLITRSRRNCLLTLGFQTQTRPLSPLLSSIAINETRRQTGPPARKLQLYLILQRCQATICLRVVLNRRTKRRSRL
jgi:hypothetical protein